MAIIQHQPVGHFLEIPAHKGDGANALY